MFTLTDLEDLLKSQVYYVPEGAKLEDYVLEMAGTIHNLKQGNTVLKIFSSNPNWIGKKVKLPEEVTIELDKSLLPDQMGFLFFNSVEVNEF